MRIVVAPDKFKGTASAIEVAEAMADGVRDLWPHAQLDLCPMSDGGEGFVEAMVRAAGGRCVTARVTGPLPEMKVDARFGVIDGDTAVVEMSAASGLWLLPPDQRDPEATTTFGTGELLVAAKRQGCKRILLGIGGSATIDGGIGCCHAAGLAVILEDGEPSSPTEPLCGRDLPRVVMIKSHRGEPLAGADITVACDVTNPLCGPDGAARVFGPQKGATPAQVERFDAWLDQLARRCGKADVARSPGAGAAGGLGFAMMAFFGATLRHGAEVVIEATRLRDRLRGVDLCITGEGRIDRSSLAGKAPVSIARLCREAGVRCLAVGGSVDRAVELPFDRTASLTEIASEASAMHQPRWWVRESVRSLLESALG
jgi:glycerate kinase